MQDAVGLLLVGEVAGVGVGFVLKGGDGRLQGSKLKGGAEFVAGSLENEDGAFDFGEKVAQGEDFVAEGDGPFGPGGEDFVGMLVVVGEALL